MSCNIVFVIAIVLAFMVSNSICQLQFANSAYVEKQLMCALDKAPCDYVGQQIKRALPNVIGDNCAACNAKEAAFATRIATFLQRSYPSVWVQLVQKYSKQK